MVDPSPPSERRAFVSLESTEARTIGYGWISGVFSALLGAIGLGAVLCFNFPSILTMPELRAWYPVPMIRGILHLVLVTSFGLGIVSVWLRRNKALGLAGIAFTLIAALLGGSRVPVKGELTNGPFLGLDWFLLNLIVYSAVYIPLERLHAHRPQQSVFRRGWRTDLTYFFVSALLVQTTTLLTLKPAMVFFDWARHPAIVGPVSAAPLALQIVGVLLAADLTQYWVHRSFHSIPFLWRFHAIHHSAEEMDWLAGSRLHLVDAVVTRGATYVPIYVMGFSEPAIAAYVLIVVIQATFIHANVRWELAPLQSVLATPRFHHWHHSAEREAVDKNFAVHLPLWDIVFGTYLLPKRWPDNYGLCGERVVPHGWFRQLVFPFRRAKAKTSQASQESGGAH